MQKAHIIPLLLTAALATGSYFAWAAFTRREVARNAADIKANGSQDNLRKGYHQRRGWVRFWVWLGCTALGVVPVIALGMICYMISFLALGLLLAGYFARYFTPLLNLARGLPYWHASGDSASWPDASAFKQARRWPDLTDADRAALADELLQRLLRRTWVWCRLLCVGLAIGAVLLIK